MAKTTRTTSTKATGTIVKKSKRTVMEGRVIRALRSLDGVEKAARYDELTDIDRQQIGETLTTAATRALEAVKTGQKAGSTFRLSAATEPTS
jgi:hypothetical protein